MAHEALYLPRCCIQNSGGSSKSFLRVWNLKFNPRFIFSAFILNHAMACSVFIWYIVILQMNVLLTSYKIKFFFYANKLLRKIFFLLIESIFQGFKEWVGGNVLHRLPERSFDRDTVTDSRTQIKCLNLRKPRRGPLYLQNGLSNVFWTFCMLRR